MDMIHFAKIWLPMLLLVATSAAAQNDGSKMGPARVTAVGRFMTDIEIRVDSNYVTGELDTTIIDNSRIVWEADGVDLKSIENNDFYRNGEQVITEEINTGNVQADSILNRMKGRMRKIGGWAYQKGCLKDDVFQNFYYSIFTFEYPSIDCDGNPIMLSAIAAAPQENSTSRVNNVILGTHITITADSQRPSAQQSGFGQDDWGMLFSLAAGNKLKYKSWVYLVRYVATLITESAIGTVYSIVQDLLNDYSKADCNNNLVVMPDYEGYGLTKDRPHPYLYQELTARQCVDGLIAGKRLYETAPELEPYRLPIRNNYRTVVCGYSQGGSVAMACHRFIEKNGLSKQLHLSGSICGDGPYDPMATLMYYVKQAEEGTNMSMPCVLPLIMKGMLDTNPYMKNHQPSDYFSEGFLSTGVLNKIASKKYTTDDLNDVLSNAGYKSMKKIMTPECYQYFLNLYNTYKETYVNSVFRAVPKYTNAAGIPLPSHRGVYEDLHFALAGNDLTRGWQPKHQLKMFHSQRDTVVPIDNYWSAYSNFSDMLQFSDLNCFQDHVEAGTTFFSQTSEVLVLLFNGLGLCENVNLVAGWDYDK